MAEQTNEAGGHSFKKSWGFGTGSVSAELQSAAAQIVEDSRLPSSNVRVLLNAFFARYLVWPFRATPGKVYDATGTESAELGSLIYTSSRDLARVPADALACARPGSGAVAKHGEVGERNGQRTAKTCAQVVPEDVEELFDCRFW
jgi:hypothetical protein